MRASRMCSSLVTVAACCLVAACTTSAAPATTRAPSAASSPTGGSPGGTGYRVNGDLFAVAATSASDAWAVGELFFKGAALIAHWNGSRWSTVPAAGVPSRTPLRAVAASSPANAWALGETFRPDSTWQAPMILHWDGRAWRQVPAPAPPGAYLSSVSVTSPANAWAVGGYPTATPQVAASQMPLALHWDGSAWRRVPLPGQLLPPGGGAALSAVSATSASDAWAVGGSSDGKGFILHWDGSSWSKVAAASASAAGASVVAAAAPDYAWLLDAAGAGLWNGQAWKTVPIPLVTTHSGNRGGGVSALAVSGHVAWLAGDYCKTPEQCENGQLLPLLLRWAGDRWQRTRLPASDFALFGVAVTSPADAWAVGTEEPRTTIILHWNGSKWS